MSDVSTYILQMKEGNNLAFVHLYRQYARKAFLMSYKYLGNKDMAEDAVQELFIKLWEHRTELHEDESPDAFIFTMLKHLLLNVIRQRRKDMFLIEHNIEVLNLVADSSEGDDIFKEQTDDLRSIFARAFCMLSPKQQQIVRYKLTGKMSNNDIAECMGISVNTVKVQYYNGLKRLRELTTDYAYMLLIASSTWPIL